MSGFIIPNNAVKVFSFQPVAVDNTPSTVPSGTTFSAFTSDFNIATAAADINTGRTTVTPNSTVTGIVYVTIIGTLPDGRTISGCIDLHCAESAPTPPAPPAPVRLTVNVA